MDPLTPVQTNGFKDPQILPTLFEFLITFIGGFILLILTTFSLGIDSTEMTQWHDIFTNRRTIIDLAKCFDFLNFI